MNIQNDIINIQNEHMKKRCYFITVMCGTSLYNWYNYSLFVPINNDFFTPYYQNCLLMLFYLGWDAYHMTLSENKIILYRTDLIAHHIITGTVFLSCINYTPLIMSNYLVMECISVMNYTWRNNPILLKFYRTMCILLVRIPLITWCLIYYNPTIGLPMLKNNLSLYEYNYICLIDKFHIFFIIYDMFILWKLYKPQKNKQK
jgi:hypothetical protein